MPCKELQMWKLSPGLYIEMFYYPNNNCLQVEHLLCPRIKLDIQNISFCLCLSSLCFSHSLTLFLYMIFNFPLPLCVWASCCMCWSAGRLLSPWNKQKCDLNPLSHGEGTVSYLYFPQLPVSTKRVRTSRLGDICPLRQMWLKLANVFENYLREKEEEAYKLMGRTYSLKIRFNICFFATKKSGKSLSTDVSTELGNTLILFCICYNSSE